MSANTNIHAMRKLVQQLRFEASFNRVKVSQSAADLKQFCLQNAPQDPLLKGVPTSVNPFKTRSGCLLL
ncbi:guanine nucleotide-binding protein G(I)/G(S)/G(O) subunit gamma-5 [Callorhinchus milii]|uniref:Guanine nucleotide-binding protein subunit gamma n=1 Tax=Callorhinchus milii TaxID=7868 RepID=V9LFX8_CALMI|nr:guanine nucleotide-binding protein G(I)/G(S)/G(O) subunit gamma-5 [Callorhinchus milii]|eukprot:gi/632940597/ref/XP_007885403.1/ PREDICTED: guanine nucleotide-binding protein G(I)/G(S)/G(O) subunit gamma-5 [Callorhinchus milii]